MKDVSSRSDTFKLVGECGLSMKEVADAAETGMVGECGLCMIDEPGE